MSEDTEPAPTGVHFDLDAMCEAAWNTYHTGAPLHWVSFEREWPADAGAWKAAMMAGIAAGWSAAARAPDSGRVADVDRVLGILDTELPERGGNGG